jgi:hypothetical protein
MVATKGLPGGTTIEFYPTLRDHSNIARAGGGLLCGEIQTFDSVLDLTIQGTGALAGFQRNISVPTSVGIQTGPRAPGDPVQDFDTELFRLQGDIFGDPDFSVLKIRGGSSFGLPSPGHTTLTSLGPSSSDFVIDSFFDIAYRIEFVGAPGSALDGLGGTTEDTLRLDQGVPQPTDPCFGIPHGALGNAQLSTDSDGRLVVSNIGSSGCDGVSIDLGDGADGWVAEVNFGQVGSLPRSGDFIIDSFFDISYRISETGGGGGALSVKPKSCGPLSFRVEVLLDGVVVDSNEFDVPLPSPLVVSNIGSSGEDGVRISDRIADPLNERPRASGGGDFNVDSFFDISYAVSDPGTQIAGGSPVEANEIRIYPSKRGGCSGEYLGHVTIVRGANLGSFTILDEALGIYARDHRATGNGHIYSLYSTQKGLRSTDPGLVVSNIGSSGEDGVSVDLSQADLKPPRIGIVMEAAFGPAGSLTPGSDFTVDSFFDVCYRIQETGGGRGAVSVEVGDCNIDSVLVEALLDDVVVDSKEFGLPLPGQLVVSNIGSSGEDGVSIDLSKRDGSGCQFCVDSFFDIAYRISDPGTTITGNSPVTAKGVRLRVRPSDSSCTGPNEESIVLRGANLSEFMVLDEPRCGDENHPYPPGDLNGDCLVNFLDVAILGGKWLFSSWP